VNAILMCHFHISELHYILKDLLAIIGLLHMPHICDSLDMPPAYCDACPSRCKIKYRW